LSDKQHLTLKGPILTGKALDALATGSKLDRERLHLTHDCGGHSIDQEDGALLSVIGRTLFCHLFYPDLDPALLSSARADLTARDTPVQRPFCHSQYPRRLWKLHPHPGDFGIVNHTLHAVPPKVEHCSTVSRHSRV